MSIEGLSASQILLVTRIAMMLLAGSSVVAQVAAAMKGR
jgi:hypothetical protein